MRTTVDVEENLLEKAARLTGVTDNASLVKLALQALIARESAKRLAGMAGTEMTTEPISRRRTEEG